MTNEWRFLWWHGCRHCWHDLGLVSQSIKGCEAGGRTKFFGDKCCHCGKVRENPGL